MMHLGGGVDVIKLQIVPRPATGARPIGGEPLRPPTLAGLLGPMSQVLLLLLGVFVSHSAILSQSHRRESNSYFLLTMEAFYH